MIKRRSKDLDCAADVAQWHIRFWLGHFYQITTTNRRKKQQQNPYTWIVELISEMEREQEGENI